MELSDTFINISGILRFDYTSIIFD